MKPGGHGAQRPNCTGPVQLPNQVVSLCTDQQHFSKGVALVYLPLTEKMLILGLINSLEGAEFSYEQILA